MEHYQDWETLATEGCSVAFQSISRFSPWRKLGVANLFSEENPEHNNQRAVFGWGRSPHLTLRNWGSYKQQAYHKGFIRPRWFRRPNAQPFAVAQSEIGGTTRSITKGRPVVLIVDDSSPRNSWPLERIVEASPDRNGLLSQVKVKTKTNKAMSSKGIRR